jgi:hypothetical protein
LRANCYRSRAAGESGSPFWAMAPGRLKQARSPINAFLARVE